MKASKSAIFLFELMIVILVFTSAAAVCTKIFAGAHETSRDSIALTEAVLASETAAEKFKADPVLAEDINAYYDENWKQVSSETGASFKLTTKVYESENYQKLYMCDIEVTDIIKDKTVYTLETAASDVYSVRVGD